MAEQDRPQAEHYPRRERKGDLPPFHEAARFLGEELAGQAYERAQEALYSGPPNDLSTYRLILNDVYHVAVLGQRPPEELKRQLERILAAGEPTDLPRDLLMALNERRRQSIRQAPWVERHLWRPPDR